MLRWLTNTLVLAFILVLPLAAKFYFADPAERAFYLSWLKQQWHRPVAESVTQVIAEVKQAAPEPLIPKFKASIEGFQQLAGCGKTQTLAITEENSGSIYRWVDDKGRVHFSDKEPGAQVNSEQMSVHYQNKKRYFNLEIIEDTSSLPAFTRDKVSADVRQIYGILSRDMALDHLRRVLLNVRIIESQDAFQDYRAKVAPQISTKSGFYIGKGNEAVIFQGDNDERMLAVVRHEATHVIVAGLYGYSPVWFNEGLAEYFEHMQLSGQLRQVQPVGYHRRTCAGWPATAVCPRYGTMCSLTRSSGMAAIYRIIMQSPGHWCIS
mgnify:CR=1 FL=1